MRGIQFNNVMFAKLASQKFNIKSGAAKTSRSVSVSKPISKAKADKGYAERNKLKKNGSDLYDYEIAWMDGHLYQGEFDKNKKSGEGFMILNTGVSIIGRWQNGYLEGRALLFTPFGGKINAEFHRGKLNGWVIMEYDNNIEINCYVQDKREPVRTRFDSIENLWVEAAYDTSGKLQQVMAIENGNSTKMPTFLNNLEILQLFHQYIIKNESVIKSKKIKELKIGPGFEYYGYSNQDNEPEGLGIIHCPNETYAGNFRNGSLDGHGLIRFSNGLIYKGDIQNGSIIRQGLIYDPHEDQTRFITINEEGVEFLIKKKIGFDLRGVPFNFGKTVVNLSNAKYGLSSTIKDLCDDLSKYYYKGLVEPNQLGDTSSDQWQQQSRAQNEKDSQNKNESYHLPMKKYGLKEDICVGDSDVDSLQAEPLKEVKLAPRHRNSPAYKNFTGIPRKMALNFEELVQRNIRKIQYPHLKEFERQKDLTAVRVAGTEQVGKIYVQRAGRKII